MYIPEFELQQEDKITTLLEEAISLQYGLEVSLGKSINSFPEQLDILQANERHFARLILSRESIQIYPHPNILTIDSVPDFYLWNMNLGPSSTGKFVELTMFKEEQILRGNTKSTKRKLRQKKVFDETGLPFVYICRTEQEKISRNMNGSLF